MILLIPIVIGRGECTRSLAFSAQLSILSGYVLPIYPPILLQESRRLVRRRVGRDTILCVQLYIAPQSIQPVMRLNRDSGKREFALHRWGLVPFWTPLAKPVIGPTGRAWRWPRCAFVRT